MRKRAKQAFSEHSGLSALDTSPGDRVRREMKAEKYKRERSRLALRYLLRCINKIMAGE
jgi:hypothetical protein